MSATADPKTNDLERLDRPTRPTLIEFVFFVLLVAVVLFVVARTGSFSFGDRDLIDTDGYMRFVRIDQLLDTGAWFDSTIARSNAPFGEELHWTRPLDVFVLALNFLLRPFLGESSLYWAAIINAPLLLIGLGVASYRAFGRYVAREARPLLMFAVVALPLVLSYGQAGRVDHHILILVLFVMVVGVQLRLFDSPSSRTSIALGGALMLGMWVSTEFLVPWFLVAATLAIWYLLSGEQSMALAGFRVFVSTTLGTALAVLVERGGGWSVIEFDKVSIVHVVVGAAAAAVFAPLTFLPDAGRSLLRRSVVLGVGGVAVGGILFALFPDLVGGPFVDVDPRVAELWLGQVGELQPLSAQGGATIFTVAGPLLVGLAIGGWFLMGSRPVGSWLAMTVWWLAAYTALAVYQLRWSIFGHLLTMAILVYLIGRIYTRLPQGRWGIVLRPVIVAVLFAVAVGSGLAVPSAEVGGIVGRETGACEVENVAPHIEEGAIVLADQDDGPELLYRTDARVIATPYHRNSSGILFLRDLMSESDMGSVAERLTDRRVDYILVCPNRADFMKPPDTGGTFYEKLIGGSSPVSVDPVPLNVDTAFVLFEVQPL